MTRIDEGPTVRDSWDAPGADKRVTPEVLRRRFGGEACKKIRDRECGFRRHHLQALVQRVEFGADEIRIRGSKPRLLQTL